MHIDALFCPKYWFCGQCSANFQTTWGNGKLNKELYGQSWFERKKVQGWSPLFGGVTNARLANRSSTIYEQVVPPVWGYQHSMKPPPHRTAWQCNQRHQNSTWHQRIVVLYTGTTHCLENGSRERRDCAAASPAASMSRRTLRGRKYVLVQSFPSTAQAPISKALTSWCTFQRWSHWYVKVSPRDNCEAL
jgi:hypothetical protein